MTKKKQASEFDHAGMIPPIPDSFANIVKAVVPPAKEPAAPIMRKDQ